MTLWGQPAEVTLGASRVEMAQDFSQATLTFAERSVMAFWKEGDLPVKRAFLLPGEVKPEVPLLFLEGTTGSWLPWQAGLVFDPANEAAEPRVQPIGDTAVYLVRFEKMQADWLRSTAEAMQIPSRGPIQVTENTNAGFFVYDAESKTSGYAILQANERLTTPGLVCGAGQPGVVLVRLTEAGLELAASGMQATGPVRVKLFGDWKLVADETRTIRCEPKAGRTWVEWDGVEPVRLERLPSRGFVQRILDLIGKK